MFWEKSKWIWSNLNPVKDEYGEFADFFEYKEGEVKLSISVDSNYVVYINGTVAAWGQYADFPYDKVYDEVDVTSYCKCGKNIIAIQVWYYGIETTSVYYPGNAGLMYEIVCGGEVLCVSDTNTLSRVSKTYRSHNMHIITPQLGLGYSYDSTKEDNWINGDLIEFHPAVMVDQILPLRSRPCDKLQMLSEVRGEKCKEISDIDVIYDLGSEQAGFLSFDLTSSCEQEIMITYGEHIVDGCVRHKIGIRDFSVKYTAKEGRNTFSNLFRRFACRYIEIHSEYPVIIRKMAIVPTVYQVNEKSQPRMNAKQQEIYNACINTLRLCMHEHYEDCPWREQALYAMDSRNQMLCGYYAFGEYRFPRANLELISKDNRSDGLLSICYPMKADLAIPSFSLHYITACKEYLQYSGDVDFIKGIYPKLESVIETFTKRVSDGLMMPFEGKNYWNFYEWRNGLDNEGKETHSYDSLIHSLLSIALQNMSVIADTLQISNNYIELAEEINKNIRKMFWDEEEKICYDSLEHTTYSQLGNSLAILCGAVPKNERRELCERMLADSNMTQITLSMMCFKYDAWLSTDKEYFKPIILNEIENLYGTMLKFGSTTVWETELGESDFDGAGSLCHGWSALPVYYYHILLEDE